TMNVKKNAMITATNIGFMTATELADVIVRTTGIPFRTAHHIVGAIAKTGSIPTLSMLDELSSEIIHEKLSDRGLTEKAIREALDPVDNVRKRKVMGGPSPLETKRQIAVIKKKITIIEKDIGLFNKKINEASDKLTKACKKCT
ncbi:MAG TPA: argininosuccinate lyase, partial [Candidatus Methanoperedens sp.]